MGTGQRYQQFTEAKRLLRRSPGLTDEQVAEQLGIHPADAQGLRTVAEARKDVQADSAQHTVLHPGQDLGRP